MEINQKFWEIISPILAELREKIGGDFVVFGSAPLYLFGVLEFEGEFNDLDIAVGEKFVPTTEMAEVFFHDDPRQKLYKLKVCGTTVDLGPAWPGREEIYEKIFNSPVEVEGFKFANLSVVRQWKETMAAEYGREKDRLHLEEIRAFQQRRAGRIEVRDAAAEDLAAILQLKDEVWVATYTNREFGISAADIRGRESKNPERLGWMQNIVQDKNSADHIWMAQDGSAVVGMCSVERGERVNKLGALYVAPSYQGMGVGRRLLEKALDYLGQDKVVSLGVTEYNHAAIAFYRKFGFAIAGRLEDYVFPSGKRMPVLEMVKAADSRQ